MQPDASSRSRRVEPGEQPFREALIMRSSIRRLGVAGSVVLGTGLLVLSAEAANAPALPGGCISDAPHHTHTFNKADEDHFTSDKAYWDNACGCYIAILDVPSTSEPASPAKYKKGFVIRTEQMNGLVLAPDRPADPSAQNQADCESWVYDVYLYKKSAGGSWDQKQATEVRGLWYPPSGANRGYCQAGWSSGEHVPPATGTDSYRIVAKHKYKGAHSRVVINVFRENQPGAPSGPIH
jgi:hypothetical protein